jgi:hypothetical protein
MTNTPIENFTPKLSVPQITKPNQPILILIKKDPRYPNMAMRSIFISEFQFMLTSL